METDVHDRCFADVAILTALPEEVLAAISILDQGKFRIVKLEGSTYLRGVVTPRQKRPGYTVVITLLPYYGGLDAAAAVRSLAEMWKPKVFVVLGIAAGNPHNVRLGDVVLADELFEDVYGKFEPGRFASRSRRLNLLPELIAKCARIQPKRWNRDVLGRKPVGPKGQPSKLHVGLVISTTSVYGSDRKRESLLRRFPDALAIEMEACGAMQGSRLDRRTTANFLVVKGISDYGGDQKADDPWREHAARAAAAHLKAFIENGRIERCSRQGQYPVGCRLGNEAEKDNWLGDLYFQQGKHKQAEMYYERAWREALHFGHAPAELIAGISLNLGHIRRLRGSVVDAHYIAKISNVVSQQLGAEFQADSDYLMGLIAREYGEMKLAMRYFRRAAQEYADQGNTRGEANAKRGLGYSYYSLGDYRSSYRELLQSHSILTTHEPTPERIPEAAESLDMLGRVLRQLCSYSPDPEQYRLLREDIGLADLPPSRGACLRKALSYYEDGERVANTTGDRYRLAESYLSYVIFHCDFPEVRSDGGHIADPWNALKSYYRKGVKLAEENEYFLLLCLFEKYMGNAFFGRRQYDSAFTHYASRYFYSQSVRAIERHNALEDMASQVGKLADNKTRRRCIRQFMEALKALGIDAQDGALQFCDDLYRALQ